MASLTEATQPKERDNMDKETLEKRIEELKKQQNQAIATAQMCEGAIQDSQYWISQLDKPEEEKENNG